MDALPVAAAPARAGPPPAPPGWSLAPEVARDTQGLVVSPFGHLELACALFLDAGGAGPGWVAALRRAAPITAATGKEERRSAAIAFSHGGLVAMGLADRIRGFSRAFTQGMHEPERRRRLGDDVAPGEPGSTLMAGGPRWSGNPPGADPTPRSVHALLMLYADEGEDLEGWCAEVRAALAPHGVTVQEPLPLSLRFDDRGVAREHFGFADGISQPVPWDPAGVVRGEDGGPRADPWHGVPLGEVLFGYANAHAEPAPGPFLADPSLPDGVDPIGRNGSYLVVRELHQDVAAFWEDMERAAAALGDPLKDGRWVAERVVGRTMDGHCPLPGGRARPPTDWPPHGPGNDFGFFADDRYGAGCPLGSHVRRTNPRDGLAPRPGDRAALLDAANNHRLLRRGRKFGPDFPPGGRDDGKARGLLFMALNTDIARQFEFVQRTWVLNRSFAVLQDETDPLVGPAGRFTVPDDPLRWRLDVRTFVRFAGGEYFFLPGLRALDWIEAQT